MAKLPLTKIATTNLPYSLRRLAWAAVAFSLHSTPGFAQNQRAHTYLEQGIAKYSQGDFDGAMADYSKAIELDPQFDAAYCNRGSTKNKQGDFDGAMADYSKAIELNPVLDAAYCNRGIVKVTQGDSFGAILDFSFAIGLNPEYEIAYRGRGIANFAHGRISDAIADFNKLIEINPKNAENYRFRGNWQFYSGEFSAALNDYRRFLELDPDGPVYYRYFIYILRAKMGEEAAAKTELLSHLDQVPSDAGREWQYMIGQFLTGKMVENVFLSAADVSGDETKTQQQRCEAWYYTGVKRLNEGDTTTARDHFENCVATEIKNFIEYRLAEAELKELDAPVP